MLKKCPKKPNCVCSMFKEDVDHYIKPLKLEKNPVSRLQEVFVNLGYKLEKLEKNYIHAVATTSLMKFKDDVEVYYDEKAKLLHFRSASRVGYSDLGANKKRVDLIKFKLRE